VSKRAGYVLLITGFLACPCHLVLTLPLVLAILGGSTAGAFVAHNVNLITGVLTGYFLLALSLGFFLLNRRIRRLLPDCETCDVDSSEPMRETPTKEAPVPEVAAGRK